jgi:nucleotide-binding universal stress UspA family protein
VEGPKRILFSTDFGKPAKMACEDVELLARSFVARVDLVHVTTPSRQGPQSSRSREQRMTRLEGCRDGLRRCGVDVGQLCIFEGSAAESILHGISALGSDLVVIGAGDRASDWVTGPTAETVARFATCPLWISRTREPGSTLRAVVGVDPSGASREALLTAQLFGRALDLKLELVHAAPPEDASASTAQAALEALVAGVDPGLVVQSERGPAAHVLERRCRGAFLLVLGRRGPGGLRRTFLGGTAERLVRSAPCSLLLSRPVPL